MRVEVITESLTNEEVARRQLDRAITLFFEEKDFVSAITLAGAAEEILGKLLDKVGKPHALKDIIKEELSLNEVVSDGSEARKAEKEIANISNFFRNFLKHHFEGTLTFSVDYYAANIINRARLNYFSYVGHETPLMEKFRIEVDG